MTSIELAYLYLSIVAFAVFAIALAGATHYANGGPEARARAEQDERRFAGGAPRHA